MTDTIFDKIIRREIPATIVYEDELCLAFKDIAPKAPIHILIIPKKPIAKLSDSNPEDQALLGHILLKAGEIATQAGYANAFRLVCNNGSDAGQEVFHLHFHLLAGRPLTWPPG
ncbi:MAG: histidine triad nucleotide-binding protein [Candidatus Oxydemutatoraceae bacterium WSBS_2016_MAG_OTU14]